MKLILIALALSLTACAELRSAEQIAPGTHRLVFADRDLAQSAAAGQSIGDHHSLKLCPRGYEKLSDKVEVPEGYKIYTWVIRCQ